MKLELVIFSTSSCQLSCAHCENALGRKNPGHSISASDLERVADEFRPHKVNMLGGEPLLWPHLERAFELFERVTVSTNGLLVKDRIDTLEKARAILVSVEGMEKNTDSIRGRGVWKRVMESVKLLKERMSDPDSTILRCSYSQENIQDVPKLLKTAESLKTPIVFFPRLDKPPLNMKEQFQLFTAMLKYDKAWVDIPQWWAYAGREKAYCPAGEKRLALFWDRTVQVCQWWPIRIGTLDDPADFVWENAKIFSRSMKRPSKLCYGCPNAGTCRSGCLVSNAFINCPLRRGINAKVMEDRGLDYQVVQERISSLRGILRGVLSC